MMEITRSSTRRGNRDRAPMTMTPGPCKERGNKGRKGYHTHDRERGSRQRRKRGIRPAHRLGPQVCADKTVEIGTAGFVGTLNQQRCLLGHQERKISAKTNPSTQLSLRGSVERQAQHIHGRGTHYHADAPKNQEEPQKTKAHYHATVEQHATTLPRYRDEK